MFNHAPVPDSERSNVHCMVCQGSLTRGTKRNSQWTHRGEKPIDDKWWKHSACIDIPVDGETPEEIAFNRNTLFYGSSSPKVQMIYDYCNKCPVATECLNDAMTHEIPEMDDDGHLGKPRRYGIWGGKTPSQRQKMYEQNLQVGR